MALAARACGCAATLTLHALSGRGRKWMTIADKPFKMVVLTRRIKMPGIMETMSEQVPEVIIAFSEIETMLEKRMESLGAENWRVKSHAQNIFNGILIVSFILESKMMEDSR